MSNSFVLRRLNDEVTTVKELHVNLWMLGHRRVSLEVGLWFRTPPATLLQHEIEIACLTPCPIKGNVVENLFDKLIDGNYSRLLLDINHTLHRRHVAGVGEVSLVEFDSRGSHLIVNPTITVASSHELKLTIDARAIPQEWLDRASAADDQGSVMTGFYVRFRYDVDLRATCVALIRNKEIFHQGIVFDFRVNEVRSIGTAIPAASVIPVERLLFFLVQPSSHKLVLDGGAEKRQYVRILEPAWLKYMKYGGRERFIVYKWTMVGPRARLLLSSEREKPDRPPVLIGLVLFLLSIVIVSVNADRIGAVAPSLQAGLSPFAKWVGDNISWFYLSISGLVSYLLGHIIWDTFLHHRWVTVSRRIAKFLGTGTQ